MALPMFLTEFKKCVELLKGKEIDWTTAHILENIFSNFLGFHELEKIRENFKKFMKIGKTKKIQENIFYFLLGSSNFPTHPHFVIFWLICQSLQPFTDRLGYSKK